MILTNEEKEQYKRHLSLQKIGEKGQLKLKKAKVLVVGAGGLGCPVLQYLTAAGVGTIGIIDDDVIDQSNLQRQVLYTINDIGASKVVTAARRLAKLNPFVNFNVYQEKLTKENAVSLFFKYDIIVDGSDNFSTRYLANDAAVITKKPLVYGAILMFQGQVSVFNYNGSATYRCLYPTPPRPSDSPNCEEIGVLGVLPGIIGSLQANETIKIICGIGAVLANKLLIYNSLDMQQTIVTFKRERTSDIIALAPNYNLFCTRTITEEISLDALQKFKEKYNLLDVRETWEREEYNIGGQHIPLKALLLRSNEVYTNKDLVVYCKSGIRSRKAITILESLNFNAKILNLRGGCF